jgi:hypothetical protein
MASGSRSGDDRGAAALRVRRRAAFVPGDRAGRTGSAKAGPETRGVSLCALVSAIGSGAKGSVTPLWTVERGGVQEPGAKASPRPHDRFRLRTGGGAATGWWPKESCISSASGRAERSTFTGTPQAGNQVSLGLLLCGSHATLSVFLRRGGLHEGARAAVCVSSSVGESRRA